MGKPKRFNTYDSTVSEERKTAENYGSKRQSLSGITSSFGTPPQGQGFNSNKSNQLNLQDGGEIRGGLGFGENKGIIVSGTVNVNDNLGSLTQSKSYISIIGETTGGDTLDQVTGKRFPGQILFLGNESTDTLTITHLSGSAGQILCTDNTDFSLTSKNLIILIDIPGSSTQSWRMIQAGTTGTGVALGDSPTWTGSHTFDGSSHTINSTTITFGNASTDKITFNAEVNGINPNGNDKDLGDTLNKWQDIYLNSGDKTSKIFFDGGGDTYLTGSGSSGRINVYTDNSNNYSFTTSEFAILNGKRISGAASQDLPINADTGQKISLTINSAEMMFIDGTTISFKNPLVWANSDPIGSTQVGIGRSGGNLSSNVVSGDLIVWSFSGNARLTASNSAWGGQAGNDFQLFCVTDGSDAPINLEPAAGDPSSLSDGDIWYNSTSNKFRGRANGVNVDLH